MIGGNGINAWRRASRWGDGYHAAFQPLDSLAYEIEGVRETCRRDRRDPDELEISMLSGIRLTDEPWPEDERPLLCGNPDEIAADLLALGKVGLEHLVATPTVRADTQLQRVLSGIELMAAEILPAYQ